MLTVHMIDFFLPFTEPVAHELDLTLWLDILLTATGMWGKHHQVLQIIQKVYIGVTCIGDTGDLFPHFCPQFVTLTILKWFYAKHVMINQTLSKISVQPCWLVYCSPALTHPTQPNTILTTIVEYCFITHLPKAFWLLSTHQDALVHVAIVSALHADPNDAGVSHLPVVQGQWGHGDWALMARFGWS